MQRDTVIVLARGHRPLAACRAPAARTAHPLLTRPRWHARRRWARLGAAFAEHGDTARLEEVLGAQALRTEEPLSAANLQPAILASCSIPFWLDAVHDIPGGPRGAYWDGGITDYHLHLPYDALPDGIALYPHFQPQIVPGWLDKVFKARHRATRWLDPLVVLVPHPDWVRALPGGKLPDRNDFKVYGDDHAGRQRVWRGAIAESQRLADEFARLCERDTVDALSLP